MPDLGPTARPSSHQVPRIAAHGLRATDAGAKRSPPTHGPVARGKEPTVEIGLENSDESAAASRPDPMTDSILPGLCSAMTWI